MERRPIVVSAALGLVWMVMGCGPHLDYLKTSPEFTVERLTKGQVAVLPVGSMVSQKKIPHHSLVQLRVATAEALHDMRPWVNVQPVAVTDKVAGEDAWPAVSAYLTTDAVPPKLATKLAKTLGVRYLALLRVEFWDISTETDDETVKEGKQKLTSFIKRTSAALQLRLSVYDGETGLLMWMGIDRATEDNKQAGRQVPAGDAEGIKQAALEIANAPYPPPPAPGQVGTTILRSMAENWPEKK